MTSRTTRHVEPEVQKETLNQIIYGVKRQLVFYRRFFIFPKYIRKARFVNCCCFHFKIPNLLSLFVQKDFIFDSKISWAKDILHSQTKVSDLLKLVYYYLEVRTLLEISRPNNFYKFYIT